MSTRRQLTLVALVIVVLLAARLVFFEDSSHHDVPEASLPSSPHSESSPEIETDHESTPITASSNRQDGGGWQLHPNASQVRVESVKLLNWKDSFLKNHPADDAEIVVTVDCSDVLDRGQEPRLSNNKELRASILRHGPHLFRLRLDGPTVFTVPQLPVRVVDKKKCEYHFPLGRSSKLLVFKKGAYRVGLEMLYRNYAFLDESRDVWPELLKTPLLVLQQQKTRTKYHLQQCTLPSREVIHVKSIGNDDDDEAHHNLPPCDGTQHDTSGVWEREPTRSVVWTRVRVRKIRKEPILFEWASQSEPVARWVPNSCAIPSDESLRREKLFQLYGGKRIVISGDSQLRALYYAVVNTLSGNGPKCVRNITTVQHEPAGCAPNVKGSQRKSISAPPGNGGGGGGGAPIQVDYIDDLFLNRIKYKLKGYDVVVAGFGQHPASREHWRFDKYERAVRQRMADLKNLDGKVIWYAAPHYPHTRAGYPVAVRDWRTDSRLELFNNCSFDAARANGFLTLDSFSISDAFAHTSPDQAHFSNFVAAEFVRMFFSILVHKN